MPLPWRMPTDEEANELVRRIDQLLADLYHLLRAVILGPPQPPRLPPGREERGDDSHSVPDLLAQLGEEDSKVVPENQDRPPIR